MTTNTLLTNVLIQKSFTYRFFTNNLFLCFVVKKIVFESPVKHSRTVCWSVVVKSLVKIIKSCLKSFLLDTVNLSRINKNKNSFYDLYQVRYRKSWRWYKKNIEKLMRLILKCKACYAFGNGPRWISLLNFFSKFKYQKLSLIHIWRCRRYSLCRSRWSPYH